MMDKRFFIAEESGKRLDVFLSEQLEDFTRSRIKKLLTDKNVTVNGVVATKAGADIKIGDEVAIVIPEAVEYSLKPENMELEEDNIEEGKIKMFPLGEEENIIKALKNGFGEMKGSSMIHDASRCIGIDPDDYQNCFDEFIKNNCMLAKIE